MSRRDQYDFDHEPYVIIERRDAGIAPFLLGLALGAGAAMLFAPRSGAETRERIRSKAREAGDAARQRIDDLTDVVNDRVSEARDAVADRFDRVRATVQRQREEIVGAFDAGRSAAHEARLELERKLAERKSAEQSRSVLDDQG